jgi:hypothetical protein
LFRALQHYDDLDKLQGKSIDILGWDESCQFEEKFWRGLSPWNRASMDGVKPREFFTSNPIGQGVAWNKSIFIDKKPLQGMGDYDPKDFEFIPASYLDNPRYANDPEYVKNLNNLSPALRAALRDGSWDQLVGAYFSEVWDSTELTFNPEAIKIAEGYPRWLSVDWGYAHHCVIYWLCQMGNTTYTEKEKAVQGKSPESIAEAIIAGTTTQLRSFFLSPDAFSKKDDSFSIAEQIGRALREKEKAFRIPQPTMANNNRVAGAQLILEKLRNRELLISKACPNLIESIPLLLHDPDRPEDVLKIDQLGDDCYDSLRYGVMSWFSENQGQMPKPVAPVNSFEGWRALAIDAHKARTTQRDLAGSLSI